MVINNMKKILGLLLLVGIVSCVAKENTSPSVGMPNPASKYCIDQGGKLIMKKDQDGNSYGICKLKTGEEIEEWEYFRENNLKEK